MTQLSSVYSKNKGIDLAVPIVLEGGLYVYKLPEYHSVTMLTISLSQLKQDVSFCKISMNKQKKTNKKT